MSRGPTCPLQLPLVRPCRMPCNRCTKLTVVSLSRTEPVRTACKPEFFQVSWWYYCSVCAYCKHFWCRGGVTAVFNSNCSTKYTHCLSFAAYPLLFKDGPSPPARPAAGPARPAWLPRDAEAGPCYGAGAHAGAARLLRNAEAGATYKLSAAAASVAATQRSVLPAEGSPVSKAAAKAERKRRRAEQRARKEEKRRRKAKKRRKGEA